MIENEVLVGFLLPASVLLFGFSIMLILENKFLKKELEKNDEKRLKLKHHNNFLCEEVKFFMDESGSKTLHIIKEIEKRNALYEENQKLKDHRNELRRVIQNLKKDIDKEKESSKVFFDVISQLLKKIK